MNSLTPPVTRRLLHVLMLVALIGGFFYLCAFKILDQDFWWHVKAGEIMMRTHDLIRVEPFSFVLQGRPYHSNHEWLAQILLFFVYRLGGVPAAIIFRTLMAIAAFGIVLAIDWKRLWPHGFLAIVALYMSRPSILDRPQIFTFVLVAFSLWLAMRFLRDRRFLPYALWLLPMQILWVNLHGAASILSIIIVGSVTCGIAWEWLSREGDVHDTAGRHLMLLIALGVSMLLAMFLTPNGLQPFTDLLVYSSDKTLPLIREWMPMVMKDYLKAVAPFGVAAIVSVFFVRRHVVTMAALIIVFGMMSLHSFRHCILFIIVSLAVIMEQLHFAEGYHQLLDRLVHSPRAVIAGTLTLLVLLFGSIYWRDGAELRRLDFFGYDAVTPVAGALKFVKEQGINGTLFNTYNQGTYLLGNAYPERKVFFDGRNLEYGYEFMNRVIEAGRDPVRWKALHETYNFTYAIIDYRARPEDQFLPYIVHMDSDKDWVLVYLDDDSSVYLKRTPENQTIIEKFAYRFLTPTKVEFDRALEGIDRAQYPEVAKELQRMADGDPHGVKSRLILARLYLEQGKVDAAQSVADQAYAARPHLPEVFELLGMVAAARGNYGESGAFFERAIAESGGSGLPVNYSFLATIFTKAGNLSKAATYSAMAEQQQRTLQEKASRQAPTFTR